jgi:hypothetical protein
MTFALSESFRSSANLFRSSTRAAGRNRRSKRRSGSPATGTALWAPRSTTIGANVTPMAPLSSPWRRWHER